MQYIQPNWPVSKRIRAYTTTRLMGNIALHVPDDEQKVLENRRLLKQLLQLPAEPFWLEQVHGIQTIDLAVAENNIADASFTTKSQQVCVVMTADCLPILMTDQNSTCVAAIHAGWRGLANGVIDETVKKLPVATNELFAWIGPAIRQKSFEVGDEVREAFGDVPEAFIPANEKNKWLADLYLLARVRLKNLGVQQIYQSDECTYDNQTLFYSYRREQITGRMASLIWME